MPEKKPDDLASPRVMDAATGRYMTNEQVLIADVQRRERQGKCVRKCPDHERWCEQKLGHDGSCVCEVCKKKD